MSRIHILEGVPFLCYRARNDRRKLRTPAKKGGSTMPTDLEEVKRKLLQTDSTFQELATKHHDLDERLHNYAARHYLTEPEQVEEISLKKQKLHLKDRMEDILRRHSGDR